MPILKINADTIYDDSALVRALGIQSASLVRARKQGTLQYRRIGNRIVYLGSWVLDWLRTKPASTALTQGGPGHAA